MNKSFYKLCFKYLELNLSYSALRPLRGDYLKTYLEI